MDSSAISISRYHTQRAYEESCRYIPGGVNSPIRACKEMGICPLIIDRAFEDTIRDVDGNEYIDFCCSWGAIIHGHAHLGVQQAVLEQLSKGTSYGITSPLEAIFAKKIINHMPAIARLRFVSSGTEATMTAVRLARAYTGKNLIVKFSGNYHGHADLFLVKAGSGVAVLPESSSKGVPEKTVSETLCLPYNDCQALDALFSDAQRTEIAAVILEPIAANMGLVPTTKEFMCLLEKRCRETGVLLIFDEVITGFRVAKGGAQAFYGIQPDLTCLGKVIGAGFPVAAVGGKTEIMNLLAPVGHVFQAGTLSGNPVAMSAGIAALELLDREGFYEELEEKARMITDPVIAWIKNNHAPVCMQRVGSLFSIFFGRTAVVSFEEAKTCDQNCYREFFNYMFDNGVYIPQLQYEAWFITQAHTQTHLEKTQALILQFLKEHL